MKPIYEKPIYEVEVEVTILNSPTSENIIIKVETTGLGELHYDTKKKLCEYYGLKKSEFRIKILRYRLWGAVL